MRINKMRFRDRLQFSFSRCWDGYSTDKSALKARNETAAKYAKRGFKVKKWSLPGQWRKYEGLGQPGSCICTVYFVDVYGLEE